MLDNTNKGEGDGRPKYSHILQGIIFLKILKYWKHSILTHVMSPNMSSGRLQDTQSNTLTPADNQSALYIISIFPRPTQTTQLSGGGLETRAKSQHNVSGFFCISWRIWL